MPVMDTRHAHAVSSEGGIWPEDRHVLSQSTSNTAFFIALGIVVLLSGIGFGIVAWVGRLTGALRGREPVPINMLTEGYLLARGKASGRTLRAPLSGRPCVWWEMKVWERRIEIDSQARSDEPDRSASDLAATRCGALSIALKAS